MISHNVENYLKVIFSLKCFLEEDIIKTNDISKRLGISAPAVTDMIKKLEREKYVKNIPYKGVSLTTKGLKLGSKMLRNHRLWEVYLHEVLDVPWDKVHDEAERLEHACTDYLMDKLDDALGNPTIDPHGNPIPDKEGNIAKIKAECKLSDCEVGDTCYILRVVDLGEQFLKYLNASSITLNSKIKVSDILEFDSSYICEFKGTKITLSKLVCDQIYVLKTT